MKALPLAALVALLTLPPTTAPATDRDASDLIEKIQESRNTRGATVRLRLSVTDAESNASDSAQLRIKTRRDGAVAHLLYQVLWPPEHKGEALCIERSPAGGISGFVFDPPETVTALTVAVLRKSYLDSNLSIEDLADDFWHWPSQTIGGEETVAGELCQIIDSRPPPNAKTAYSLIRSWVSTEKLLPLRIEKFTGDKRLAKRFTVQKVARNDRVWVPTITNVQSAGQTQQTTLEISRGDRDVEIPLETFSLEKIRDFAGQGEAGH